MSAKAFGKIFLLTLSLACVACSRPTYDPSTDDGKQAIIDLVNIALTRGDCATAIETIEPLYDSQYADDKVRYARASAHACQAGINFFGLLGDLAGNDLAGPGFWRTLSLLFPSTTDDAVTESSWFATDALMAIRKPGVVILPANQVNADTHNVGSILPRDRKDDANAYLLFVSMATIGSLQTRYSDVDPITGVKNRNLGWKATATDGWTTVANLDTEGCSYASAVLNLFDSLDEIASEFPEQIADDLQTLSGGLIDALDVGCDFACQACGFAAGACNPCPKALRNRNSCEQGVSSMETCAAAGLINVINSDDTWGYGP